ncbi:hypothetical protein [Streptomyces sp. NPDC018036]|uniref:hypothetical protein n=1 Tax=Streptomyces sp. NPDC018036 TaxID=3365035 RepID=UPI0037936507
MFRAGEQEVVRDLGGARGTVAPGALGQNGRERAVQAGPLGGCRPSGQGLAQEIVPEPSLVRPGLRQQSGPLRLPEQGAHLVQRLGGRLREHVEAEPCSQQGGEVQQPRGAGRQSGGTGTDRVPDPDGDLRRPGPGPVETAA